MKAILRHVTILFTVLALHHTIKANDEFIARNNISYITMENGLLNDFVDHIHKDSRGFLWLATRGGGLSRYDGYEFVNYNLSDSHQKLRSNFINSCCEDSFGRLWITSNEGIDILDLSRDEIIYLKDRNGEVPAFFNQASTNPTLDSKGNIWVCSSNVLHKIAFDDEGNISNYYTLAPPSPDYPVTIKDVDNDGNVWLAVGNEINKIFTDEKELRATSINSQLRFADYVRIRALCVKENEVWIGTEVGLYRYNRNENITKWYGTNNTSRGLTQHFITDLAVNSEKQLIVSTYLGLNIYNPVSDDFEQITMNTIGTFKTLNSNFINCLMVDEDILWIGTETGGLNKYIPKRLYTRNYVHDEKNPHSLLPNPVNSIISDKHGSLWIGTVEGGLSLLKKNTQEFVNFTTANSNLTHNSVSALAIDADNRIWAGTWGNGITAYDITKQGASFYKNVTSYNNPGFPLHFIGSLCYDPVNNYMWVGSDWGIYYYDIEAGKMYSPFEDLTVAFQIHNSLGAIIDTNGHLWMGCASGVYVFDLHSKSDGKFKYTHLKYKLDTPDSNLTDRICSFLIDKDNTLWIGSNGNGIYKHIPKADGSIGQFINYSTKDGLISNVVRGILEDNDNRLWLSTNNGLSRFDKNSNSFTNFNRNDGLMENQFYWNAYSNSYDGMLYFGTVKGLIAINPKEYYNRHINSKVTLTRLSVMNEEIHPGSDYIASNISMEKTIRLHEKDKSISLEFAALNFDYPTTARYAYRLKGFEEEWIVTTSSRRYANYTNLKAGKYYFQVKYAANAEETEQFTEIEIIVKPFFYKTRWFILLMAAMGVALFVFIAYRRIYVLQKQKQILNKTVEERTHELKEQNVTLIKQN